MTATPRTSTSSLTNRISPARRRIYDLLLATEGREWTISEFVVALARSAPTSPELVRSTIYLLAADRIVRTTSTGRALGFVLTTAGAAELRGVIGSWRSAVPVVPHPLSPQREEIE